MLKDLSERSKPSPKAHDVLSGLILSHSRLKKSKPIFWLTLTVVCLFSLIVFTIAGKHIKKDDQIKNTIKTITSTPAAVTSLENNNLKLINNSVLTTNPTTLTGITLEAQKEMTNLRLFLNQDALYRIISHQKDSLTLILERTYIVTNLPQISTVNSAINVMQMKNQKNGDLEVVLKLKTGTELERVNMHKTKKFSELEIDFSYKDSINLHTSEVVEEKVVLKLPTDFSIKKVNYDTSVDNEYKQAINYASLGQDAEAIKLLTEILDKDPAFMLARKMLASLLVVQGDTDKAQEVILTGLQQKPFYPDLILLKAQILVDQDELKEALALLQLSPPPINKNPEYHAFIAALYQRLNEPNLAENVYEKLVKVHPNNSTWWMGLGIARESLNKNKDALSAYKIAMNKENINPELRDHLQTRIHNLS